MSTVLLLSSYSTSTTYNPVAVVNVSLYIDVTKCFFLGGCYFGGFFFTCAC